MFLERSSWILIGFILLCSLMWALFNVGDARAQFLNRECYPLWAREDYENYARVGYRDYDPEREQRTFDPFGIYLLDGIDVFRLEEYRSIAPFSGSTIFKSSIYKDLFQNLTVSSDHFASWSSRLTIGNAVDARFTPLTLSVARLNGIRWDSATRRNRFAVVGSRVSDPLITTGERTRSFASYLYGGHWEGTLGDVLTFGASYVNLHYIDSLLKRKEASQKGVVPSDLQSPRTLYVIVYDDSPGDGSGARIYDMRIYVDGALRSDILPEIRKVSDVGGWRGMAAEDISHLRRRGSWLNRIITWDGLSGLVKKASPVSFEGAGFLEASGTDVLVYAYEVPPDAGSVDFAALVSHDYSIDLASELGLVGVVGITWDDWHNVRRASGNPLSDSNIHWERFGFGVSTGLATFGADMKLDLLGFNVQAEYARNLSNAQYPTLDGKRYTEQTDAFFVALKRPVGQWVFGGELFEIPATFATSFTYWRPDINRFDTYDMIDDNDDGDQWPDSWEHWDPWDPQYNLGSVGQPTPQATRNLQPAPNVAVGSGVFPGLDEDDDGVLDTNVNNNSTPDYLEPFLMYHAEPEDFVFGDDFDNNGVVDARENDNLPDLPYEPDSKGRHGFVGFRSLKGLAVTVGHYDARQGTGGGRNRTTYLRTLYQHNWPQWGGVSLNHIAKRTHDDIPSSTYEFIVDPRVQENFSIQIRTDPLEMKNSLVNTFFTKALFTRVRGLSVENSVRHDTNRQFEEAFEDGSAQKACTKRAWAMVNKADYSWQLGSFEVLPMLKYMMQKKTSSDAATSLVQNYALFPILRIDYKATQRTIVRAGVQGLPGFKHIYRSAVTPSEDFDAEHYILAIQGRDNYVGYDTSWVIGYTASLYDYVGSPDRESRRTSEMFLQMRVE